MMIEDVIKKSILPLAFMYNISEDDTVLGIAELSFDLSVFDIFSVLGVGGTLVLPNPEKGPDASHWGRLLNEYKVTLWNSVPAQAEMLDAFASKSESYPTVRLVLLSGDWINTSLPGRLRRIMTNAQIVSLGGATEGGIWSVFHEIDEIEERPTICILGGTGNVGYAAYKALEKSNYYFRIGVRNRDKAEKMNLYKRDNVQLFEIDLDKSSSVNEFCDGANIIIGAIGPSTKYSEKMLKIALEMKIPYIDPGGMYLKNKYSNREIDITAIVGAGLFPGVSGWLLYSELKRRGGKQLIEIVIGGKYNFSRGAAIDYVEEIKENAAGVPMACIRNGNIVPASSMVPSNIISDVCGLAFLPYVTEEIQEIIYTNEALNIDAYTAVPKEMFTTLNKLYGKNEEIIKYLVKGNNSNQRGIIQFKRISENETKTIFIRGSNPGDLTGKILAISANAILYGKKKRGIFTMANYLSDYPLIDKLKGIKGFEYREEVQYA